MLEITRFSYWMKWQYMVGVNKLVRERLPSLYNYGLNKPFNEKKKVKTILL